MNTFRKVIKVNFLMLKRIHMKEDTKLKVVFFLKTPIHFFRK